VTIRSMTGFGRAKGSLGEEWTAEVIARSWEEKIARDLV